ncbi:MAG: DUF3500 domain-containing protein [Verrucomicrobiales bacterium]
MNKTSIRCLISTIACSSSLFFAASVASAHESAQEMAQAANTLLAALDDAEKAKAVFAWDSEERQNWHFIPKDRNGLTLKDMSNEQRHLAYVLLSTGMSHVGYQKALTIMSLEQVLHELENNSPTRDTVKYYFSIFGTPGNDNTWGWRVEGHHLSLNFTIIKGKKVSATPTFFGANPGIIQGDHRRAGLRTLGKEEDLGRELFASLNPEQMKQAVIEAEAPNDVLTPIVPKVEPLANTGILYTDLNDEQKLQLEKVIDIYVSRIRPELAESDWKKIRDAGINNVRFAWAGPGEIGAPHYYRVQGPTFVMEWANVQNGANHPHSVWRDFDNDFGADLLRKHLAEEH